MKHFVVTVGWNHRNRGPQRQMLRAPGSNMPLAIKRALGEWLRSLSRKERLDVGKGITLTVVPVQVIEPALSNETFERQGITIRKEKMV